MKVQGYELEKVHDNLFEIPKQGNMLVPGRIYTNEKMIAETLQYDESVKQVVNVAHLPGIQKYSLAMPDIHWGYGFPIGGVAATDVETGVISPGGVGYDINCGVRVATTGLKYRQISGKVTKTVENLFKSVPTGVGSSGAINKLSESDLKEVLLKGSQWAVENGFGTDADIEATEEHGCMKGADYSAVSDKAIKRGLDQAGTLGSGNHFLEIDVVDEIYDEKTAEAFGLFKDQVVMQVHTGSRGFGYQVCDDYIKRLLKAESKFGFELPDRQLVCAPLGSDEGKEYLASMKCAANFAWNNRQIIMSLAKGVLKKAFSVSESALDFRLLYDVAHNIAKIEDHEIDGKMKSLCVHRKGATRAFPAGSNELPEIYRNVGQPVLIPGDMGRYSFIAVGGPKSLEETFGSSCHGAGRVMSRHQAMNAGRGKNIINDLKKQGIVLQARGLKTVAEEMPKAYKDVANVIDVMHGAGISSKVAKLKPVGVIKG